MLTMKLTVAAIGLVLLTQLPACKKNDLPHGPTHGKVPPGFERNEMVLYWNDKTSTLLAAPTLLITPPGQCRFFAMVQIAVHDALNTIAPTFERYALQIAREPSAHPDAAVASAAYHTIKAINIQGNFPLDDWYAQALSGIPNNPPKTRGIEVGKAAADAIISKRANDNYAVASQQLPGPDGVLPGAYRSTLPFSNPGMPKPKPLSQWSTLTPFVLQSSSQFRSAPPYPVNSPQYTTDYNEVKAKGAKENHTRTADETNIGVFWVERSAIGWNRLTHNLLTASKIDALNSARLLALLHTAMVDGSITNFESKYHYFYWRPETAIRLGDEDGNDATVGDPAWLPSYIENPNSNNPLMDIYTPPIPEYPSQHANFGAAAGRVLQLFFGKDNIPLTLTSPTLPGVTRQYNSFSAAIRDNSLSRIYVGYHFRKAVDAGEKQGIEVAEYVFNHAFR